jgi:hypothetical protein
MRKGVKPLLDSQTILCYWNRMARPLRIEYPDAWYHVMNRGRSGENVFADEKDYCDFLALLQEASKMFGLRVAAFCLTCFPRNQAKQKKVIVTFCRVLFLARLFLVGGLKKNTMPTRNIMTPFIYFI